MAVRLIATDLDGTLLRSDSSVSARARAALAAAEEAGLVVVFVTGRPPRWMAPVVEATGHRGLAVCANGAVLFDLHEGTIVHEHHLDAALAADLVERLHAALPGLAFAVERGFDFAHEAAYRLMWESASQQLAEAELAEMLATPMAKLLARHDTLAPDEFIAAATPVIGDLATVTYAGDDGLLEISAAGVTKAFALERLAAERGIDATEVVAFGDMPNDLPMLAWAGHAVAMADAHPDVLAAADEITATNDEDGVAVVIERLLSER
ncbi:HAD family hydrolase [soil metagenome]